MNTLVKWLSRAALVAGAFLVLELAVRAGGAIYVGLRPPAPPPIPSGFRILCVGDSFTFGFGAHPGKSYPQDLQGLLDRAYGPGRFAVINRGIPNLNSTQLAMRLPEWLSQDRPDLVLILIGWEELKLYESSYFLFAPMSAGWRGVLAALDMLLRHSRLYSLARLEALDLRRRRRTARLREDEAADRLAQEALQLHLRSIRDAGGADVGDLTAKAEAKLRESIARNPTQPFPHFLLGEVLARSDRAAATAEWRKAAALDPTGESGRDHLWEVQPGDPKAIDRTALQKAYAYDIGRMREAAGRSGARLVVETYHTPLIPVSIQDVAANDACFIDNVAFFGEVKRHEGSIQRYLASNPHLNDAGYLLMARHVFDRLSECGALPGQAAARSSRAARAVSSSQR